MIEAQKDPQKYLNSSSVNFSTNIPTKQIIKFLTQISEWKVISLSVQSLESAKILLKFEKIHYPVLDTIKLSSTQLQSIEAFCILEIPKISLIDLQNNKITEGRLLRKGYWKKLRYFFIYGNNINLERSMTQMSTANNVWKLGIQNKEKQMNVNYLVKLKAFQVASIEINNKEVWKKLIKRYLCLKML